MGGNKRDFQELIQQYYTNEEMNQASSGDTRSKDIE